MQNWFECKVRYERNGEKGALTRVNEAYLVEALSYTEAEAKIIDVIKPYVSGEFMITDIKRGKYNEIFASDLESADKWFKIKMLFITLDEASAVEKKTSTFVLVQAADLAGAITQLNESMKGSVIDYEISTVAQSPILEVFRWSDNPGKDEQHQ